MRNWRNPREESVPILNEEEGGFCLEDRLVLFLDDSLKLEEIGDGRRFE